ncbi:uncharacterized membrane protein YcaP (DUF421 family) [Duganella sp. SG902]|uniref:DUF421 domain-containing protein n=1 Tax=Duganella sp. SG902 TaxID=2587016 RepID=UPI00159E314C|nr:YetF domain-containing protein [Duganella sp. SG902]NVM79874.1 uncharacterized membrane protein YcaP (DUF421 family) [Duganella sp. SG902]
MFDMSLPWWEFILRGVIVYCVLLVLVRVSGKRTVGQFTPFDLLVVMLLSEAVSNSLSGGDDSVAGGLLIACTLIALNMLLAYLSSHHSKLASMIDGECVLLGKDGRIYLDVLKRNRIAVSDVEQSLREADVALEKAKCIFLEADGSITVLENKD